MAQDPRFAVELDVSGSTAPEEYTDTIFTTGPVKNGGESGSQRHLKNKHIRFFVRAKPHRILFDYANILNHKDSGRKNTARWKGIWRHPPKLYAGLFGFLQGGWRPHQRTGRDQVRESPVLDVRLNERLGYGTLIVQIRSNKKHTFRFLICQKNSA